MWLITVLLVIVGIAWYVVQAQQSPPDAALDDAQLEPLAWSGVIENANGDELVVRESTSATLRTVIVDDKTFIRTLDSDGRFLVADRSSLQPGARILLVEVRDDGRALWIDIVPDSFLEEDSQ